MAISLVQSKPAESIGVNDPASLAATFDSAPAEDNLLVGVLYTRVFQPAYSLTVPIGFSEALQLNTAWATVDSDLVIFYKVAGSSESSIITFTIGNDGGTNSTIITLHIMEWSGLLTSSPLDVTAEKDETSDNSLTSDTGTTGTTAVADSLVIAASAFGDDDFDAIESANWADSYTQQKEFVANTAGQDMTAAIASKILSSTGAQNTGLTLTGGGTEQRWSGIAVFKGITVDKAAILPPPHRRQPLIRM